MVLQQHSVSVPQAIFLSIMSCRYFICIPQCLIFMARGLFAHWCFQFIKMNWKIPRDCKVCHSKSLILFMSESGGETHVAGRGSDLWNHWRLHLPSPLSHSFYLLLLCPSLFSNFYFFLFYTPFILFNSCLSPSLGSTSSASFCASFLCVVIFLPPCPWNLRILPHPSSRTHSR